jgi:hypothetical protein
MLDIRIPRLSRAGVCFAHACAGAADCQVVGDVQ